MRADMTPPRECTRPEQHVADLVRQGGAQHHRYFRIQRAACPAPLAGKSPHSHRPPRQGGGAHEAFGIVMELCRAGL
jgi:hypothetical protein